MTTAEQSTNQIVQQKTWPRNSPCPILRMWRTVRNVKMDAIPSNGIEHIEAANGFDETTVQQIADSADIGAGTLFLYVADKSELLLVIFHEAIEQELVRATIELDKRRRLTTSVAAFFRSLCAFTKRIYDCRGSIFANSYFTKGKSDLNWMSRIPASCSSCMLGY